MPPVDSPPEVSLESLVAQVADEFTQRLRRGEDPQIEEYAARYPEQATALRQVLAALQLLRDPTVAAGVDDASHTQFARETPSGELGDFRILREIGRGGMGVVYEAEQISLRRRVALKVLPYAAMLDARQLKRFQNEAQAAAALHHTNIVPVYAVGSERGVHYYAMQYIEGQTLDRVIGDLRLIENRDAKPERVARPEQGCEGHGGSEDHAHRIQALGVPPASSPKPVASETEPPAASESAGDRPAERETVRAVQAAISTQRSTHTSAYFLNVADLGIQVAGALHHAHEEGVLHRDIKPSNLILDARGRLWVADFGLAHIESGGTLTMTGDLLGTLRYMSPEQALGKRVAVDQRTDIYSLGVTLYELLTLRAAFEGDDRQELLRRIASEDPPAPRRLNKAVPAELETIVLKAIEKNPADRYATAEELADDLERFRKDEPIRAKRPTLVQCGRKWARRHKAVVWSLGVSSAVLLVMAVVALAISNLYISRETEHKTAALDEAQHRLCDARLAQARASRFNRRVGRRFGGWQALTEAARLARELELDDAYGMELRNEAIACLALADVRLIKEWEGWPPGSMGTPTFDADLRHYARSDSRANISVRSVDDDRELAELPGAAGSRNGATELRFSPQGDLLAARYFQPLPGNKTNFVLWDWQRRTRVFESLLPVSTMRISPDGSLLALGQDNGTLLYDVPRGKESKRLNWGFTPGQLAFDPSGTKLAASNPSGEVQVRDVASGNLLRKLNHPAGVYHLAWHPDGIHLAVACNDSNVHVWDTTTGRPQTTFLQGHQSGGIRLDFSLSGGLLLTDAWDGTTRLWDFWTGRQLVSFPGVHSQFSRDGRRLAVRRGSKLEIWEVAPGREYRTLPRRRVTDMRLASYHGISPDGHWFVAAGGNSVRLWDLVRGAESGFLPLADVAGVTFHPSGRELFTSGRGLHRWPVRVEGGVLHLGPPRELPTTGTTGRAALDREGRILAVVSPGGASAIDLEKPQASAVRFNHVNANDVATSPDGQWVATGVHNGFGVKVWEARSGKLVRDLIPAEEITRVAFSPDGRWLVTGAATDFSFWTVGSWELDQRIRREQGVDVPGWIAFAPRGALLAIVLSPTVVQLLDAATGRPLANLEGPDEDSVESASFSPDGGQLVVRTASSFVHVWDLRLIRERLSELDLDWDLRPYPPPPPLADVKPLKVEIDFGELAPKR